MCNGGSREVMEIDRVKNRDDRLVEMMSAVLFRQTNECATNNNSPKLQTLLIRLNSEG